MYRITESLISAYEYSTDPYAYTHQNKTYIADNLKRRCKLTILAESTVRHSTQGVNVAQGLDITSRCRTACTIHDDPVWRKERRETARMEID